MGYSRKQKKKKKTGGGGGGCWGYGISKGIKEISIVEFPGVN